MAEWPLLISLSDPRAPIPAVGVFAAARLSELLKSVELHGAEPVALRKLAALAGQAGPELDAWLAEAGQRQMWANAYSMQLEAESRRVSAALASAGIAHAVVKGPAFAHSIYDQASDRPFTDIDIVSGLDGFEKTGRVMQALGFTLAHRSDRDRTGRYLEQKWQRGNPVLLVEIHGDLIHYPGLRKRLNFGLGELELCADGGRHDAVAHFMTAVVHAMCGHKLHNLHFVTDMLQAFRAMDDGDLAHLGKIAGRLRALPEIRAGMSLIRQCYAPEGIDAAIARFQAGEPWIDPAFPVTAAAILGAPKRGWGSRMARNLFRLRQHLARRT